MLFLSIEYFSEADVMAIRACMMLCSYAAKLFKFNNQLKHTKMMFEFSCIMNWIGLSWAEIVIKIPATTASRMGSLPHYRLVNRLINHSVLSSLKLMVRKFSCGYVYKSHSHIIAFEEILKIEKQSRDITADFPLSYLFSFAVCVPASRLKCAQIKCRVVWRLGNKNNKIPIRLSMKEEEMGPMPPDVIRCGFYDEWS